MASTKAKTTAAAEQVEKRCACGCNAVVNPKRSFKLGHDQAYKGALLRQFDAGNVEAGATLVSNGWKTAEELTARTTKATEKAEAKAKREADRSARVRAKEAAAKEKATAKVKLEVEARGEEAVDA